MSKPYRPSNGTEGMIFESKFCDKCKKHNPEDDSPKGYCQILFNAFCNDIAEEDYPKEWIYDSEEKPICTAFKRKTK